MIQASCEKFDLWLDKEPRKVVYFDWRKAQSRSKLEKGKPRVTWGRKAVSPPSWVESQVAECKEDSPWVCPG